MSVRTNRYDLASASCLEQARGFYRALTDITTGKQRVQVRYGDQWTEYHNTSASDVAMLRQMYMAVWNTCPEAQKCLPNLSPSARVLRGPAMPLRIG